MKILYHHRTRGEEPESVHIAAIVGALRGLGHEVDILGPGSVGNPPPGGRAEPSPARKAKRSIPRPLLELIQCAYNLVSAFRMTVALLRRDYDFVYERYAVFNAAGVLASRVFSRPLILEVNTLYAQAWAKYYGLTFQRAARAVEHYVLHNARAIVTVTEALRREIVDLGVPPDRVTVSHNAVDPREFDRQRFAGSDIRARLRLPATVVGFVGTMNRWQGVRGFAEAIARVAAERDDIKFLFVGDGEGRAGLEQELRRRDLLEFAIFLGRQRHEAVPELISAMDIGILLDSNSYGSPMKVFEYWAMGAAVIAPAVAPVLEVLRDGETGLLIAAGDAAAMADCILALARDETLRARLAEAGRRRVLATHTWDQNAARILEMLAGRQNSGSAGGITSCPEMPEAGRRWHP
jgi:glycosyltransferase involved in cell wall biosynthesis